MALFKRRKPDSRAVLDEAAAGKSARRPETIGELLKSTRLKYGKSVEDVGSTLRIRAAFLKAIEGDQYTSLPGPVYALGFVRTYADYLGLDAEAIARRFKAEVAGLETKQDFAFPVALPERSLPGGAILLVALIVAACAYGLWYYRASGERTRPERVAAVPAQLVPPPPVAPSAAISGNAASETPAAPASGGGALASPTAPIGPAAQLSDMATSPTPPSDSASTSGPPPIVVAPSIESAPTPTSTGLARLAPPAQSTVAPAPPPVLTETTIPEPPATAPSAQTPHVYGVGNGAVRIVLKAKQDSWIQVKDNTQTVTMRVLKSGESYRVPDRPGLILVTGNAGALEVWVDGHVVAPVGLPGKKRYVALDPDRLTKGTAAQD
jgi:cytoskeleton protein RodZ